ncbi:hypothetical protein LCGC14_2339640, partial [marine sediment metagenome]
MRQPVQEKIDKACLECGQPFVVHPYRRETAKFCSIPCGNAYKIRLRWLGHVKPIKVKRPCAQFPEEHTPWNKGIKYGPDRIGENHPAWKGGKPKCIDCGKQLTNQNTKRCILCHNVYKGRELMMGEKHHNWKGGITPLS